MWWTPSSGLVPFRLNWSTYWILILWIIACRCRSSNCQCDYWLHFGIESQTFYVLKSTDSNIIGTNLALSNFHRTVFPTFPKYFYKSAEFILNRLTATFTVRNLSQVLYLIGYFNVYFNFFFIINSFLLTPFPPQLQLLQSNFFCSNFSQAIFFIATATFFTVSSLFCSFSFFRVTLYHYHIITGAVCSLMFQDTKCGRNGVVWNCERQERGEELMVIHGFSQ